MKKVLLAKDGSYELVTIAGAVVFALSSAIGLGFVSPTFIALDSIPTGFVDGVTFGIGCFSFPIFSAIWWGILSTVFGKE